MHGNYLLCQRDTFRDPAYWDGYVRSLEDSISKYEAALITSEVKPSYHYLARYTIFRERLKLLIARYSRGDEVRSLREQFPLIVDAFVVFRGEPHLPREQFTLRRMDDYVHALWLLSLSILLDASQHVAEQIVTALNSEGQDAVFDRLVDVRVPMQRLIDVLLYPRPYEYLHRAMDAHDGERDQLIALFLKRYYRGMRHTYWYGTDPMPNGGFFGYWCFELAAFVKALDIPDDSFADNVYYPRDLVRGT